MNIEIADKGQLKELFKIHAQCFQQHIAVIWGWDEVWQWDYFLKEWNSSEWRVLFDQQKIIGYLVWVLNKDHLYLKNIALVPEYRKQGLGKEAMHYIEQQAKAKNFPIKLSVFRTNTQVISFYQKRGFRITEEVETGVRMCLDFQSDE